uniref:RING-type domain-containing protein n=1 Tax=Caenorhabditis tropicalis TaxID=1561998 RepID=A0A1I7TD58_9PELO
MITDFKSNETVQSLSTSPETQGSTSNTGIQSLIPQFLSDICKEPICVELRVSYDAPTVQSTYYYSITWEEESEDSKYKEILEQRLTPKDNVEPPTERSNRSFHGVTPVRVLCDGPCKREFSSNLLNTIGRCDHLLCAACYGIVKNQDGTNGCSSASCNWKGANRKEAKRFFEKEICAKQRARAREMKALDIDVKSASSASSNSNSFKSQPSTPTGTSETDCSVLEPFSLSFPSKNELIGVKMIIFEPKRHGKGWYEDSAELEALSSSKINKVITDLVLQKYNPLPRHHHGVLYHVELQPNKAKKAIRVRTAKYNSAFLYDFSQISPKGDSTVFLLDFGGFVKDGDELRGLDD